MCEEQAIGPDCFFFEASGKRDGFKLRKWPALKAQAATFAILEARVRHRAALVIE